MDIRVPSDTIKTASEALSLLQVCVRERVDGSELLIRWLEGMQRDLRKYLGRGTLEMQIGSKRHEVTKEVAGIVSEVGSLAQKWRPEFGDDLLAQAVETLDEWLRLFRQRRLITLTVISAQRGTIAVSSPGLTGRVLHIGVVLLALTCLGLASDEGVRQELGTGGEVELQPT